MRPCFRGLPTASFHLMRRLSAGSVSGHRAADGTAKCPESLCPMSALPSWGSRVPPPPRVLPLGPSSYGLMRQSLPALPSFGYGLVQGVLAGCYQPLLPAGSSRRYLCESFPGCLVPYHGGPTECSCLFLPRCHRPSPEKTEGRLPACSANTTLPRVNYRGCRHFFMFRPPSLLASQVAPTAAPFCRRAAEAFTSGPIVLRCLHTHRIC
jgi:hypothetical protein